MKDIFKISKELEETIEKLKKGEIKVVDINGKETTIPEINKISENDAYQKHIKKLIDIFGFEYILINHKKITEKFLNYEMD